MPVARRGRCRAACLSPLSSCPSACVPLLTRDSRAAVCLLGDERRTYRPRQCPVSKTVLSTCAPNTTRSCWRPASMRRRSGRMHQHTTVRPARYAGPPRIARAEQRRPRALNPWRYRLSRSCHPWFPTCSFDPSGKMSAAVFKQETGQLIGCDRIQLAHRPRLTGACAAGAMCWARPNTQLGMSQRSAGRPAAETRNTAGVSPRKCRNDL